MSQPLTDELYTQLEGAPMRQISQQLGIGPAQMAGALSAALPMLLGALGRNAQQPQGAQSLFGALSEDHRGLDLGSVLGSVLGSPQLGSNPQGEKILGHVFGDRQPRAEQSFGAATGLGADKSKALLGLLAPVVMAYLAKRMFEHRQASAAGGQVAEASPQVLGQVLGEEQQRVHQQGGMGGGLLGQVFDKDGDGQVGLGDLLKAGTELLGARR
jgi:hypothetical protein